MGRSLLSPLGLLALLPAVALAVPGGEAGVLDVDGGLASLTGIAASDDGSLIAAADRSLGGIYVWHEAAFSSPVVGDGCAGAVSVVFVPQSTLGDRFYVGCADGQVLRVDVDSSVPPTLDVDDSIVLNGGVGTVTELAWAPGDLYVHAIVQDGSTFSVHRFSISDASDLDGLGLPLVGTGTISALTAGANSGALIAADNNGGMSWVGRSTSYSAAGSPPIVVQGSSVDMVTSDRVTYSLWADRTSGDVWTLSHLSSSTAATRFLTDLEDPSALAILYDGLTLGVWVGLQDGTVDVYGASDGLLDASFSLPGGYATEFAAGDGADDPVYAAGSDSTVRVLSDRPWVSGIAVSPDSVQDGDTFTLSFTSDTDGSYDVRSGGPDPDDGSSLASGDAEAGVEVSVALSVDDLPTEGENRLFVYVTAAAGDVGKDSVVITRDTPPEAITDLAAAGGDTRLSVTWTSTDDPDIASYTLYLSDTPFTADDDPLPTFAVLVDEGGDDERTDDYPADVAWTGASTAHTYTAEGLTNDTTYYVAIQATDDAGLTSPLSPVTTGVPVATCAASECADDVYGCTCAPNSIAAAPLRPHAGWLALLLLVPVLRRR